MASIARWGAGPKQALSASRERRVDEPGRADLPSSAAIELGLVARFLERLGDHAVNVTRRLGPAPVREAG